MVSTIQQPVTGQEEIVDAAKNCIYPRSADH